MSNHLTTASNKLKALEDNLKLNAFDENEDWPVVDKLLSEIHQEIIEAQEEPSLTSLMLRQRELMNVLGIPSGPVPDILTSALYKDVLIMMAGEVQEALEPLTLTTKPWKQAVPEKLRADATEELVDTLFFFLEAVELAGLTASQIDALYEHKRRKNLVRKAGAGSSAVMVQAETPAKIEDDERMSRQDVIYQNLQRTAGILMSASNRGKLWNAVWDYEKSIGETTQGVAFKSLLSVADGLVKEGTAEFSPGESMISDDARLIVDAMEVKAVIDGKL